MDLFSHIQAQISNIDELQPITVALSGGIDSVVLLHALKHIGTHPIHAIHIHHGLQSINDQMHQYCVSLCEKNRIPLITLFAKITQPGNIENLARAARYDAFSTLKNQYVCLAHHKNDLQETRLIRLHQGRIFSLPYSMPQSRTQGSHTFIRPLLNISKNQIKDHARQHHLHWIEDPSNQDRQFLRNKIRALIPTTPELTVIAQTLEQLSHGVYQFEKAASQHLLPHIGDDQTFNLNIGLAHPYLFRLWVLKHTHEQISHDKAFDILQHLKLAKMDAKPQYKMRQFYLKRFQSAVFLVPSLLLNRGHIYHLNDQRVIFRSQLQGHRHFLKRLFQKHQIPYFFRDHLPIIIRQDKIIAVWGIFIDSKTPNLIVYWNNPTALIEKYPFPLLKEGHFQYTKPENIKDSYVTFNCQDIDSPASNGAPPL
ncbi:tRNA lysidine(34) synthetase TilS [Gammaproteobacteria bacterium]|nr:tRNA lysidine(34) synthetase TilS [Gammaproteobacteria bacterium]